MDIEGVSDKHDQNAIPSPSLVKQGYLSLSDYCTKANCGVPWHKHCLFGKPGCVTNGWRLAFGLGLVQILLSSILLICLYAYSQAFNKTYGREDSKATSLKAFVIISAITANGMLLILALVFERRKLLWFYLLMTLLIFCSLLLMIAEMSALGLRKRREEAERASPQKKEFDDYTAVWGIFSILGATFTYFAVNMIVYVQYDFTYVYPKMFQCGP